MTLVVIATPRDVAAQGKGRPKNPRATTANTTTPGQAGPSTGRGQSVPLVFRQYGSWLDDASTVAAGRGWTGVGIGYWRAPGGSQLDVPMLDVGVGLAPRVQAAAWVPFYHVDYGGTTARGLDDVYLSAKVMALDAENQPVGLAVTPILEVLSAGSGPDGRLHWALPVSVELRRGAYRLYGSAGYFSRGAVFTGGAVEYTARAGTSITGAVTQSRSTSESTTALAGGRQRVDASLGIAHPVAEAASLWASVGRTLTSITDGGTSLALTGGVTLRFSTGQ